MDLSRVIALANGKGGVGKTSLTANLAGEFAREGSRVLVVDLDVSGNVKLDLGLVDHEGDDFGQGIVQGIVDETPLHIVKDVRPGIDWVPGGQRLNWLLAMSYGAGPGIPKSDPASWEGLQVLGPLVAHARKDNPDLEWLGMVLFGHQSTATRIRQNVLDNLAADDHSSLPLLETSIRASEKTAQECRLRGLLVRELAARAASDPNERLRALRARRHDPSVRIPEVLPQSSTSMADDYAALAAEIAARILAAEEE